MGKVIEFRPRATDTLAGHEKELAERLRNSFHLRGFPNLDLADQLAARIMDKLRNRSEVVFRFEPAEPLSDATLASIRVALNEMEQQRIAEVGIALVDGALLAAEALPGTKPPGS